MPIYQIEMLWTCSVCRASGNRGLERHCAGCGKPKSDRDEEYFPEDCSESNALSGEKLRDASAGPDWKCRFCDTLQNSARPCCTNCGCNRETGRKDWETDELEVIEDREGRRSTSSKRVRVDKETSPNPKIAPAKTTARETLEPQEAPLPRIPRTSPWKIALPLVGALLVLGAILFFIFRTRVVEAHISSVHWEHRVVIDRWQTFNRSGWDPDTGAFDVQNEGPRIHHYDHVRVGSHQETYDERYRCGENCSVVKGSCRTTSRKCTSQKNGAAKCTGGDRVCSPDSRSCTPKYCSRVAYRTVDDYAEIPAFRTWFSWRIRDWAYHRTVKRSGDSLETSWPTDAELEVPLGDGERERNRREASYRVEFTEQGGSETWTLQPTADEFQRYPLGARFRLRVGVAHGVDVLGESK